MFGLGSPSGSSLPPGAATPRSSVGGGANEGADDLNKDPGQVSAMPLPPSNYIKLYTDENVARRVCPLPPPPINESYTMFGHPFSAEDSIIQSLESQGIKRLYSTKDIDRKRELNKLNHSLLVNFLDLLDLLIKAPESSKREEKIEDCNLLFIHMHHLINEFRPHQARETLRVMLHVQKRRRLQVAEKFQQHLDRVQETIEDALRSLPEEDDLSNKLTIDKDLGGQERMDCSNGGGNSNASKEEKDSCLSIDQLMCEMADEMTAVEVKKEADPGTNT